MREQHTRTRRQLLAAGANIATVGLVGCSGLGGDTPGTPDTSGSLQPQAGWPAFGRDAANTGSVRSRGPTDYGAVAWRTPAATEPAKPGDRFPGPVVTDDLALVTVPSGPLRAVSLADGSVDWERDARGPTTPAVAGDTVVRRVEFGNRGPVRAIDIETGDLRWKRDLPDVAARGGVTVGYDTVFATGGPRSVYALARETGRLRWMSENGRSRGAPALADDRLFVATDAGVVAYDAATGERRWRRALVPLDTPSTAAGRVFVPTDRGVTALGVDGDDRWTARTDAPVRATPAVTDAAGGVVVAATVDGTVVALDPEDGRERWRRGVDAPVTAPVAIAGDVVYVPTHREEVAALSLTDGSERWRAWIRGDVGATPVVVRGQVLAVDADGRTTLLRDREDGLSFPDVGAWRWPNADPRNTNRADDARLPSDREVRWRSRYPVESGNGAVVDERVVLADGTAVYALSTASGDLDWRETFPDVDTAAVRAAAPGVVYVAVGGELVAFESTPERSVGSRRWTANVPAGHIVSAATPAGDHLYMSTFESGALAAVDATTGDVRWAWSRGPGFSNPPAVGPRHVYIGGTRGNVFAVERTTGELVNETAFEGGGGPIALHDGVAIVARDAGEVLAFSVPDCEQLWAADLGTPGDREPIDAPLAVTDDRVYAVGVDGGVAAYDRSTGAKRATTRLPAGTAAAPRIVDDTLLVGTWSDATGARLHALSLGDLTQRWSTQVLEPRGFGTVADVVPVDGSVFVLGPELARVG